METDKQQVATFVGTVRAVRGQIVEVDREGSYAPRLRELLTSPENTSVRLEVYAHGSGRTVWCLLLSSRKDIVRNMQIVATGSELSVPVGPEMRGRVVNLFGEPQDGGDEIQTGMSRSIYAPIVHEVSGERIFGTDDLMETGIKAVDFFTPFLRGDRVGLVGGAGVGKTVLLTELLRTLTRHHADTAVFAGIGERIREGHELWKILEETNTLPHTTLMIAQMNENAAVRFRIAWAAATLAEYFRDEHDGDVLFFVDNTYRFVQAGSELSTLLEETPSAFGYQSTLESEVAQFEGRLSSTDKGAITSIQTVYVPADELGDPGVATVLPHLDAVIVLSRAIAQQGHYPPIDFLRSRSGVMSPSIVGKDHYETATEALDVLVHRERLSRIVAIIGKSELSTEDQALFERAERLLAYMTQPLASTESHTGKSGVSVPRAQTIGDVRAILSGSLDSMPIEDFRYIGGISKR